MEEIKKKYVIFQLPHKLNSSGFFFLRFFNLSSIPSSSHSISSDIMFPLLRCFLSFIPWNWFARIGSLIRWKFSIVINEKNYSSNRMNCAERGAVGCRPQRSFALSNWIFGIRFEQKYCHLSFLDIGVRARDSDARMGETAHHVHNDFICSN